MRSYSGGVQVTKGGLALLKHDLNLHMFFHAHYVVLRSLLQIIGPTFGFKQLLTSDLNGSVLLFVLLLSQLLSCPVAYLCVHASVCHMLHRWAVVMNI